jgi:protein tyrosine/serine phosphatase
MVARRMAGLLKEAKRGLRRRSDAFLRETMHNSSSWLRRRTAPALCYAEMLLIDFGIARAVYPNRHRIADDVWRSAQPAPHHLRWMAGKGIKTVINLRGDQLFGTRWLEEQACRRLGLALVDVRLRSRSAPSREEFRAVRETIDKVEFPILLHCKSGADRAGIMSALVLHLKKGIPIADARRQLALRYGHFRHADTGVLDYVFDCYLEANAKKKIDFWEWIETAYDPEEINRTFRSSSWANRLVNDILDRE